MDWKYGSLGFFILGIICLPLWPYSLNWSVYPSLFCWFVTVLTLLVSFFVKRGGSLWRGGGHG